MDASGFLNQIQEKIRAPTAPAAAARVVVTQTREILIPLHILPPPRDVSVETPLKPNHPKNNNSTPSAA